MLQVNERIQHPGSKHPGSKAQNEVDSSNLDLCDSYVDAVSWVSYTSNIL